MDHVRIGLIGLGNIGSFHAQYLLEGKVRRAQLVAVSDKVESRLKAYAQLATFAESSDLIRSNLVDAVIIATPHYFHTSIGIEALRAGLHVLVEKPLSVHVADCERLIAAYQGGRQVFASMFNQRTDPHYVRIKRMIDAGELGAIRRVNWIITDWFRTNAYYASGGWRATWKGEGGGVLMNQCPHQLDLLQWLCGMPRQVRAFCALGKYHPIEVEDEVTAYLAYEGGATGVFITCTGEAPGTNRLEIAGDRGRLVAEGGEIRFTRNEVPADEYLKTTDEPFGRPDLWNVDIPVEGTGPQHVGVTQNFCDAILDGAPLIAPAQEGIRSVELANAMLYSGVTGQTVQLPLDGAVYERFLQGLIAGSKSEKKVVETGPVQMAKSF